MKKLTLFFLLPSLFALTNCTTFLYEMDHYNKAAAFDLSKYSSKGFLVTTETYSDKYESIGFVESTIYPEVKKLANNRLKDYIVINTPDGPFAIENIYAVEAVDEMYNKSVAMGADAIIKFKSEVVSKRNGMYDIPGIKVTGFAIKRIH